MDRTRRRIALLFAVLLAAGCASSTGPAYVEPEIPIGDQDLGAARPAGQARVIFFNDAERDGTFGAPGANTARTTIEIDGKALATLGPRCYVQVFLPAGSYAVEVRSEDAFDSSYELDLEEGDHYFRVFWDTAPQRRTTTELARKDELPRSFEFRYAVPYYLRSEGRTVGSSCHRH